MIIEYPITNYYVGTLQVSTGNPNPRGGADRRGGSYGSRILEAIA